MFFFAMGAWLVGVVVSLINYNRKLPLTILSIGSVVLYIHYTMGLGHITTAILALLAVIIWIANKFDMH